MKRKFLKSQIVTHHLIKKRLLRDFSKHSLVSLLAELANIQQEQNSLFANIVEKIDELNRAKKGFESLEPSVTESLLPPVERRMFELEKQLPLPQYYFECDISPIMKKVNKLGEIILLNDPKLYYSEIDAFEKEHNEPPTSPTANPPPIPPPRERKATFESDQTSVKSLEIEPPRKIVKETQCLCFGERGEGKGKINNPRSVCYDKPSEMIFITSYDRPKVYVYSRHGFFISKFGKKNLQGPVGVCVSNLHCYVTDDKLNAILKYSTEDFREFTYTDRRKFKKGSGVKEFGSIQKLAIDEDKDIYVIDSVNNRISVLNLNLDTQSVFGQDYLHSPKDICIPDLIYVLDLSLPHCVHGILKSGERIRSFINRSEISKPIYFCFTPNEKVIISGAGEKNLKAFSLYNNSKSTIEAHNPKPGVLCALDEKMIVCAFTEGKYAFYIIEH